MISDGLYPFPGGCREWLGDCGRGPASRYPANPRIVPRIASMTREITSCFVWSREHKPVISYHICLRNLWISPDKYPSKIFPGAGFVPLAVFRKRYYRTTETGKNVIDLVDGKEE
jgi:hypothetical protein